MDPELQRAKKIFERAIELDPEARADYVQAECADAAPLRERVGRLLAEHDKDGDFLASRRRDSAVGRQRSLPQVVAHYRLIEKLGSGGMGEVWKAEDTRLRRIVALKFLSSQTVDNEEVKARLIREAQASASLDHPNICQVFGIHEEEGETFIAMACVDGPSLADRIKERPLPLNQALDAAIQIADGLQEAHEKGIVHRDIKPHNVMLTAKGQAKIMDFGLASLAGRSRLTKSGTTLGTPAYMAPEQLEGREADRRADIWALGCVLHELLTQKTPFEADHEQALASGILNGQPEPVTALRSGLPMELDRIIGKALAKDPDKRYQHAEELAVDLRAVRKSSAAGEIRVRKAVVSERSHRAWQAALAAALIALAGVLFWHFSQAPIERTVRKWSFTPEALMVLPSSDFQRLAVSPNGKHIAFVAGPGVPRLWIRDIDSPEPRELAGTEGAVEPFWSPDSRFIGFAAGGELKKISFQGGAPVTLCRLSGSWGGSWSPDGESVVFGTEMPPRIYEVSARGGQPTLLFEREGSARGWFNSHPHFLPREAGARSMLLEVGVLADREIVLKNLETGDSVVLAEGAHPVYSSSGHVVYVWQGGLWALPFSLEALKPTGKASPVAENGAFPSVSKDGMLVSIELQRQGLDQLVWRNRAGKKLGEIGQPQQGIAHPTLSPDGRQVAVASIEGGNQDIWVHEIDRPTKRKVTFDPRLDIRPQWSPSGLEITFQSLRAGFSADIYSQAADGTGEAKLLVGTEALESPFGWSRDGNYLVFSAHTGGHFDLRYLKRKGGEEGFEDVAFLATPFSETAPNLSPDGRFLAYCSNASGEYQVYVRSFPSGDGKSQVSTSGGCQPRWSGTGRELFYVEGDTLMAVEVTTAPTFAVVSTKRLFSDQHLGAGSMHVTYDVSADGRFVLVDSVERADAEPPSINVVENWYEEFRGREQD